MKKIYGVVAGTVLEVEDPNGEGRIRVEFPWMEGNTKSRLAAIASLMAGPGRGTWFMPEKGDEVLVAFHDGNPSSPYIVGFLWNGQDKPPFKSVRERAIKSKNGHALRFLDSTPDGGSMGAVVLEDAHGNRITMSNGKITISSQGYLVLDAPSIVLQTAGVSRVVSPNGNPI